MGERRAVGALETAVLESLWAAPGPSTPREILAAVDPDLAYTTVVTILTRLVDKGLVERERRGRTFRYRPRLSEADLLAGRMAATLASAGDRRATLSRFVEGLPAGEATALRVLLEEIQPGGGAR